MKTIKNSISMKLIFTLIFAISFTAFVNGQFQTPSPDAPVTQVPTEDVRTTSSVEYSIVGTHTAGEEYRWEVTGGTITAGGTVTTVGAASVIEFEADAHTITVDWDQVPASEIASLAAEIKVQKISAGNCPSQIQTLPINIWNLPTANITDVDIEFCSGDATPGSITVDLEGAPAAAGDGFSVSYAYVAPDIEDGTGSVDGQTGTVTSNTSTVTIPLPASLINTVTTADRTFTVNMTLMQDDFSDQNGTWTAAGGSYVITVHPVVETGDIQSTISLSRR
ncbi:MAG: hypothetical protein WD052_03190 [Bacteroidales bacterium]